MKCHWMWAAAGWFLVELVFTADALKCVICEPSCATSLPKPKECPAGSKYCQKTVTASIAGVRGSISRACASSLIDGKMDLCVETSPEGRLCHSFCDTNGCNGAPSAFVPQQYSLFLMTGTLMLVTILSKNVFSC